MDLRNRFTGAWMLESYTEHPVDGPAPFYPLGENAEGIIMYTPEGFMSAQIMRVGRPEFASGEALVHGGGQAA
jgi:hypothetical protein